MGIRKLKTELQEYIDEVKDAIDETWPKLSLGKQIEALDEIGDYVALKKDEVRESVRIRKENLKAANKAERLRKRRNA